MADFYKHKTPPEEKYLSILKKFHPELIVDHVEKRHGYDSVVLIINKKRLFKFPQRREVIDQYLLEEKVFSMLKSQCSFQVPNILELRGNPENVDGFTMEYGMMEGNHLTLEMEKRPFEQGELEDVGRQIGGFLTQLHSLETRPFLDAGVPVFDPHKWHNQYSFVKEHCFPLWNKEQQRWASDLYENFLKVWSEQTFSPVFIHGDLGSWHVFSQGSKVIGFIDWGGMRVDDPAYDLKWHESENPSDRVIGEAVLRTYGKGHKIDKYFFERTFFYKSVLAVSKFIKGVQFNDKQRIQDGYKLMEKAVRMDSKPLLKFKELQLEIEHWKFSNS